VRVSDISVSRCHTILQKGSDGFYVNDNKSKFGTLVRVQEVPELISDEDVMFLQ